MRKENQEYAQVVAHIRKNWKHVFFNKYLTGKNRVYLILFAIGPKTIRRVHRMIKKL